ncbi:radical SAM/SPASM domain-containing protein [uncultured Ruminococcus sp.]|uniref:radical SAM/SPASM domain-containing protein n=1 Tax=uncultured Ruminococcus sp. TaxID=165186 RepID=UPI0025D5A718|nr:radical SAM protein [uncultured Ruminococcus sp.]
MRYLLHKNYCLRGWTDHTACLECYPLRTVEDLTAREYGLLRRCDGKTEVDTERYAQAIEKFSRRGIISETDWGCTEPFQAYHFYENRRIRNIDICITGCCDLRCRHCFNAADSEHSRGTQATTEQLVELIGKFDECGVANVTFSGGEPLLHKGFLRLAEELAARSMHFRRLVTNLYHMTPEIADRLLEMGHRPLMSTSFDGLGTHEWLRRAEGSEKRALESIVMVKDKGFRVRTTCCVWRDSMAVIKKTVLRLQELGVDEFRLVPVEPSLRWRENADGQTIGVTEWLEFICGFIDWWYDNDIRMQLDVWSYWRGNAGDKHINIVPDGHCCYDRQDKIPACSDAYATPYIDSDGRIALCNAISGYTKAMGWQWGNVFTDDVHALLREGPFIDQCRCTIGAMKKNDPECQKCEWEHFCMYGCRAEALAYNGSINSPDRRMCAFFKQGFYDRFKEIADRHGLVYDR